MVAMASRQGETVGELENDAVTSRLSWESFSNYRAPQFLLKYSSAIKKEEDCSSKERKAQGHKRVWEMPQKIGRPIAS